MYKHLEWDSDFFRFKVAKIIPEDLKMQQLEKIIYLLKKDNYRLLYWQANPHNEENIQGAGKFNGVLSDIKTTFLLSLEDYTSENSDYPINIHEYDLPQPNNQLINLALQSGEYSRFKTDKNFPSGSFEKLYIEWIRKSVEKILADTVLIYKSEDIICGMITLFIKGTTGNIGLIGVDKKYHGRNIGKELMSATKIYFKNKNCTSIEVVTQERNNIACNFYINNGFTKFKITNFYHFWL